MRKIVALCLCLCLLAGCVGKSIERRHVESRRPETTAAPEPAFSPEPTEVPTPTPEPTEAPTPEPTLPEAILALLELTDTDYVMDQASGDLNGDGFADWAVVIERPSEAEEPNECFTDAPRTLVIIMGDGDGGYTLGQSNDHFIRRDTQGGMNPDPYGGISIAEGELHYEDFGGSAWKWENSYTFSWHYDMLILTQLEVMTMYRERGIMECYDFEEGKIGRAHV